MDENSPNPVLRDLAMDLEGYVVFDMGLNLANHVRKTTLIYDKDAISGVFIKTDSLVAVVMSLKKLTYFENLHNEINRLYEIKLKLLKESGREIFAGLYIENFEGDLYHKILAFRDEFECKWSKLYAQNQHAMPNCVSFGESYFMKLWQPPLRQSPCYEFYDLHDSTDEDRLLGRRYFVDNCKEHLTNHFGYDLGNVYTSESKQSASLSDFSGLTIYLDREYMR
ncbi:hypothetical protein CQA38_05145 [Campylobacter sp. MIT 12-5580]|uniref:hypothetical protein n=1 Tax=Campylobacter sp. MIT 12-5580 TaxID=2040651 RepID=UPI0010F9F245|nr:hypothetical protein [Campylobacter sp. MIT 12-5580]TKX28952.1 hypothetical protein CQA38_05145 [Campylobacter sp. MIT 12-5580]